MHGSSPTSRAPLPGSAPSAAAGVWEELSALSGDDLHERLFLQRLLEEWCAAHGAAGAALYLRPPAGGALELELAAGEGHFPEELDAAETPARSLPLPGGLLSFEPAVAAAGSHPLALLLAATAKCCRLRRQLKDQHFQVNYRGVELEALYDVGLAVAATLDLEQLSEEILLRAASLLDARRGALYLVADGHYRAERTFGGDAGLSFAADDRELQAFLSGGAPAPADLLPGARHLLGVAIEIESSPRGFLAVGDKESRRGVGPFPPGDRRTLGLFANQAAIALENARLHRQALEKERLERELDLAAEIQRQILPKGAPEVTGFDLVGWNRPARQVGGDYYDLLPLAGGRVSLVLGDVSGKGMPAALMVSTLHSALRLLLDRAGLGPEFLERLNTHILESSASNKFITLLLAELDPSSGHLQYLNAGHNPGLLLRRDGGVEELGSGGIPLGLLPGSRYESRDVVVQPGDLVCIYSDGITEAEAPDDEEFGTERLLACLRRHRNRPLQAVVDEIDEATIRFAAGLPQRDDQTLILLRRQEA